LVSLIRPQDHKKVDKRLISSSLPLFFWFCPRVVRDWVDNYCREIGIDFDESKSAHYRNDYEKEENGAINMGYVKEK